MEEKDELRDFYIVLSLDFALLHYSYYLLEIVFL